MFTENKKIENCEPLREYIDSSQKIVDSIKSQGSIPSLKIEIFYKAAQPNKSCPYKKLFLAIMPKYTSEEMQ